MEQPYLIELQIVEERSYNPNYGDDRVCKCGHDYYRHFDSYPDWDGKCMQPVGCKYCDCYNFEESLDFIQE